MPDLQQCTADFVAALEEEAAAAYLIDDSGYCPEALRTALVALEAACRAQRNGGWSLTWMRRGKPTVDVRYLIAG